MREMKILYITYDGILEPLGQSQVLEYQEELAKNFHVFLMSFEKSNDLANKELLSSIQERVSKSSINWISHRYHKSPALVSTFYDLLVGILHGSYLVWKHEIKIIHARSYPPALIALVLKKLFKIKFIFDMRGFWADERVDGNIWKKNSSIYKVTKSLEKKFILNADHIISLTHAAVKEIKKFSYVHSQSLDISVISTCVNLEKFTPRVRVSPSNEFVLGYLGTVGTWYLFAETVRAFSILLSIKPNAKILIINKGEHPFISATLEDCKIPMSSVELISAKHSDVPHLIKKMDATIFFLKPLFSKQAAAPTKLGEFLASGIPCLTNEGVGDMAVIVNEAGVGKTINDFSDKAITKGVIDLIELSQQDDIIERCTKTAAEQFSLKNGIDSYSRIYNNL